MTSDVEQIKERLNIVDVVSPYVKLHKAGAHYKGISPFTSEKTPSFFVSPDRGLYHCFSSGKGGDMFTFIEEIEGVDFRGALTLLADQAGIELTGSGQGISQDQKDRMYAVLKAAEQFFHNNLGSHPEAKEYILGRGITEDTIKSFSLGYALDEWRSLHDDLIAKGFSIQELQEAGLVKEKSGKVYDVFRDRIVFPIADTVGRTVGFSGRALSARDGVPKYLNSPETRLFKKSQVLFGYDRAKQSMRKHNFAILVEGQMDLVLSHQASFTNTIAVSGTSFTLGHASLVGRQTKNIVLAFDSDKAGLASLLKTAMMLLPQGMDVKVALLPNGKDPADLISEDKELWRAAVREAKHVINAVMIQIASEGLEKRALWKKTHELVLPLIHAIPNSIDQAHFIREVYRFSDIPEDSLRQELRKIESGSTAAQSQRSPQPGQRGMKKTPKEVLVNQILAFMVWQEGISNTEIQIEDHRKELTRLLDTVDFPEVGQDELFQVEILYAGHEDKDVIVTDMIRRLEIIMLKEEYAQAQKNLQQAELQENEESIRELLKRCQELSKKISILTQEVATI